MRAFRSILLGSALACPMLSGGAAFAQSATPASSDIPAQSNTHANGNDDIVVTAQRRSERLQDVPLSIAAFNNEQLAASGTNTLEQLGDRTPGLYFKSVNVAMPNIAIRGIGTSQIDNSAEAPVGLFVDDVYIARFTAGLSGFYDIERIEVLRGPQGTLYGRNTIGGAINVVTRDPTRQVEGEVEGEIGSFGAIRTRAAISGPLSNTLSARVAFASNNRDGWTLNATTGRRTNDERNIGARFKLLFEPSTSVRLKFSADYSRDDQADALPEIKGVFNLGIAPAQPEATPNDPYIGQSDLFGFQKRTIWSTSLKGEFDLSDGVGLTTITGYQHHQSAVLRDLDASAAPILATQDGETGHQFSQEVRLASTNNAPFKWLVGLYYFKEHSDRSEVWTLGGLKAPFVALQGKYGWPFSGGTASYAAFGQVSYAFAPQLEIVGGLRYSHDKKQGHFHVFSTAPSALPSFVSPTAGFDADVADNWDSLDPAATLNFRPSKDVLIYASYKTGFKSGGFQDRPSRVAIAQGPYAPEHVQAYEAGIKTEWFDHDLIANLSAFHYDYRDLQQLVLVPNSALTITDNVGRAQVRGAELELTAKPTNRWSLNLGYAYLDAVYKDYVDQTKVQRAGNLLNRAPKHMINLSTDYSVPVGPGDLNFRLEYNYQSQIFYTSDNSPVNREAPYGLLNGRIAFTTDDDHLTVALLGSNLTKTVYCANQATSVPSSSAARCWVGAPRQIAFNVKFRFR